MLNRLFILLGVVLIVIIGSAFIAPRFFDWSGTRPRMEQLATESLGADVKIGGEIDFVLLPQPRLTFGQVVVGPVDSPFAETEFATADFSLLDFLRDRFAVTQLVLKNPKLNLVVDETGQFKMPLHIPSTVNASNVSIANALIEQGSVQLNDMRTGESWRVSDLAGTLKLSALRGPFGLNASGLFNDEEFQIRVTTSPINDDGTLLMTTSVRPTDGNYSLSIDGAVQTADRPSFTGKLNFKQKPELTENLDDVRGDLVFESELDVTSERARFTSYTLLPDENRAGARLTGAAVVNLGQDASFDAVISGGVVALTARDARKETGDEPYEFFRLLNELPKPLIPTIPGRVGIDVSELDLRSLALRDVRVDAVSDGQVWDIENFEAVLTGDTQFRYSGTLRARNGRPEFDGQIVLNSERLSAFTQLWRKPGETNPLFGIAASMSSGASLVGDSLAFNNGILVFDGISTPFDLSLNLAEKSLDVNAAFSVFDAFQSRAFMATLPALTGNNRLDASFEQVTFDLRADQATVLELAGSDLAARGVWSEGGLSFTHLSAGDLGGASFTLAGTAAGSLLAPKVTTSGRFLLNAQALDAFLPFLQRQFDLPSQVSTFVAQSLPLNLDVDLNDDGEGQNLRLVGRVGSADLTLDGHFVEGLDKILTAPVMVSSSFSSDEPQALLSQLGMDVDIATDGEARAVVNIEGAILNSLDVEFSFNEAENKFSYIGNAIVSDFDNIRGRGSLDFELRSPGLWAEWLGANDLYLPPLQGVAELNVSGGSSIAFTAVKAQAGDVSVSGDLSRIADSTTPLFAGDLNVSKIDVGGLVSVFGGPLASSWLSDGVWPDGPFSQAQTKRVSRGRINISTPTVVSDNRELMSDVKFDLNWTPQLSRVRNFVGGMGNGKITANFSVCCSDVSAPRQVIGRATLNDVEIATLLPKAPGQALGGEITGSTRFEGTGGDVTEVIASLSGEGSFTWSELAISGFDPNAFLVTANTANILELDSAQLVEIVGDALAEGDFLADEMSGVFSVAGGKMRSTNLATKNSDANLLGDLSVDMKDLTLSGTWALQPTGEVGDTGLINDTTARIAAVVGGDLVAPTHTLDIEQMVDGIKVRGFELEVERLEKLRADQEAKSRAAAEERARLMAIEAQRKLDEELARAEAAKAADAVRAREVQEAQDAKNEREFNQLLQDLGESRDPLLPGQNPTGNNGAIQLLAPGG